MTVVTAPPGPRLSALRGQVVMMDDSRTVIPDGVVYVQDGTIVDVAPAERPPPVGFGTVPVVATGGTLFPGLIELHNHLPYDVLGLWPVPRQFSNRAQWSSADTPEYRQLVTGPMQVLGADPETVAAVVRFVETRCLLGGTTTSQGVTLASSPGIVNHFRGVVRTVENPGDADLPAAATHISDVAATNAARFLATISGTQKMILHLAEGTDADAHDHFAALEVEPGSWAITPNLISIHCVALTGEDFGVMAEHGGSMVWSPLSNLLLYGQTADVGAALEHGVPIALGSDWAPTGSKNLLGELKVARLVADDAGLSLSDVELVAMATSTPARLLGWESRLGSLEPGKLADLVVVAGTGPDPHAVLVDATEASLELVMIGGVARTGTTRLMAALGVDAGDPGIEITAVGGQVRVLNLTPETTDPDAAVTVAQAQQLLTQALADLPDAPVTPAPPTARGLMALPAGQLRLAVEGLVDNNMASRHHLPLDGRPTGPNLQAPIPTGQMAGAATALAFGPTAAAAAPDAMPLPALTLDPLTAVDNPGFYQALSRAANLPAGLRDRLVSLGPAK